MKIPQKFLVYKIKILKKSLAYKIKIPQKSLAYKKRKHLNLPPVSPSNSRN